MSARHYTESELQRRLVAARRDERERCALACAYEAVDPMGDAFGHDVALQVLARAFAEDVDVTYAAWRAWYTPEDWLWWARGLGAFIGVRIAALRAGPVPPSDAPSAP